MGSFEIFEQNLHEMLNHLYDPTYRPPESLWKTLGYSHEQGLHVLRDAILAGIDELKPAPNVPATTLAWRIYHMLRYRYVEDLPQELAAEKLGITPRHLRRNFLEAIHALSLALWEKSGGTVPATARHAEPSLPKAAVQNPDTTADFTNIPAAQPNVTQSENGSSWHEQLVRELESLEETAAGAVSNVTETVHSVLRLATHLTKQRGISLLADPVSPQLMAAIHPSALRQILISIIDQLAKQMEAGEIRLAATPSDSQVLICLTVAPLTAALNNLDPISDLLSSFDIAIQVLAQDNRYQITLALLKVDRCVLVIDDNTDMAHLYRRYLAGTRYYIQHISRGERAFEAAELYHPDLVVLDVMLPDIDGWDLLTRLHENPATRPLPVMICSVMREAELAHALGARYFLPKPVQRQDFIRALDWVLQQS